MKHQYAPENVCEKALKTWGKNAQMLQLLEEMSELQKVVIKNISRGLDTVAAVAEEAADVMIMMEQLIYIYGIDEQVRQQAEYKINRLKKHLEMP